MELSEIFPMKLSEFKISISVESRDEKTAENYRNAHSFPNYQRYRSETLKAQIEDLNEDCVKFSRPYLL